MLDWLIDPDDDPETEFWEYCEGVAADYVIEFLENKYDDDADLEEVMMMVFNHRGVQLPLRAEEITDYCYRQYDEQKLVWEIQEDCPDVYDNLMDYVMDRVRDREAYERCDYDDRY